ncbi:phage major tail tube protein [Rummeliibacillus stabekisii]|uniref:Phage tail protein n=1 Tax=Rummeliibacillus stabekisii TaxID=241244 RepID=A0A143HCW7_9BACL|nr:phage major tail tube protein [Rummeliibacillus stabekisii]AMW99310.1 hypothetical protein ATY39_07425 [Rummeliibacillus stabekisii]
MPNSIPYAIADYSVYLGQDKLKGVAGEITLPDIEEQTESFEGAGILGEIEVGTAGRFSKFEVEFPFVTIDREVTELKKNSDKAIYLRAAGAYVNKETGKLEYVKVKITLKGPRPAVSLGKLAANKPTNSTVKMKPFYIKVEVNDEILLEVDKLNGVYKLNGEDQLSVINSYL